MNNSIKMLSPFVLYCQKVIPLAFDESMSYYECLCALYSYLKDTVVPAVNNNAEALEEVQKAMAELKEYVDTYFENLNVQEQINNKLDEMAESGELAEIIAQFLEMQFIYGFDTIADMKAGDSYIVGSIIKVLGKTSYEIGDGGFYRVRQVLTSDVIDEINIVSLTNFPSLIAEKIQDYYINEISDELTKRVKIYHVKTTNTEEEIQEMLNDEDVKIIDFETGNYTFTETLHLTANTKLLLNNSILTFNIPTVIQDWTKSHGFFNFEADETPTQYNGKGNIEFIGGTLIHGNVSVCHAKNIKFINMDFEDCYNDHFIELCAIDGVLIENCKFNGITSNANNKEYINLDNATFGGFPFFNSETNPTYDNTGNKNIQIINNKFLSPESSNYKAYNFIGSHGYVENYYHENIIIKNNEFMNSENMSIQLINSKYIVIEDNYFYCNNNNVVTNEGAHIRFRNEISHVIIKNNVFDGGYRVVETASPHTTIREDIKIINNTIKNFLNYVAELSLLNLFICNNCLIDSNIFENFGVGILRTNSTSGTVTSNKYYVTNNIFITNVSIDAGQVLIKSYDGYGYITNNTFKIYGTNKPYIIALGSTSNKAIIKNDYNIEIIISGKALFTSNYNYDYKEIKDVVLNAWGGSTTSLLNETPTLPFDNFTCANLTLGNSLQTYTVQLRGWNISQASLDARTWAIAIGNGYAKFTINSNGTFTYDANGTNVALRQVQLYNYI